jgi:hypothetical protein
MATGPWTAHESTNNERCISAPLWVAQPRSGNVRTVYAQAARLIRPPEAVGSCQLAGRNLRAKSQRRIDEGQFFKTTPGTPNRHIAIIE